jgi:hypothetical protein
MYAQILKPRNPKAIRKLDNTVFNATGSKMVTKEGRGVDQESVNI